MGCNEHKRAELTRLADFIIGELVAPAHRDKRSHLFEICMEVAAAAHGDGSARRITPEEKRLLAELFRDLHLRNG